MRQRSGAVLEAPALVPGLDDVAVMGEAIEQRRCHLWVSEHARPFAEGEIGGDQDRGALVEPADEVKEKLAAGLRERQVAELVEDDEVHAGEIIGHAALASRACLGLELVDEIDGGEEAAARSGANAKRRLYWRSLPTKTVSTWRASPERCAMARRSGTVLQMCSHHL